MKKYLGTTARNWLLTFHILFVLIWLGSAGIFQISMDEGHLDYLLRQYHHGSCSIKPLEEKHPGDRRNGRSRRAAETYLHQEPRPAHHRRALPGPPAGISNLDRQIETLGTEASPVESRLLGINHPQPDGVICDPESDNNGG
jgi:hypothetical protein